MVNVAIRRAVPEDLAALQMLYRQLDDVHAEAEPEIVPMHDAAPRTVSGIEQQIANDVVLVASVSDGDIAGEVVGFAHVRVVDLGPYFMFPRVAEVEDLAVLEPFRGLGVGKRLMQAAEEWASRAEYVELWVSAWTFNEPAAGLYRGQGFVPLSTRFRKRLVPEPAPKRSPEPETVT